MGFPAKPVDMAAVQRMVEAKFTVGQICQSLASTGVIVSPEAIRRRLKRAHLQTRMMAERGEAIARGQQHRRATQQRMICEQSDPWPPAVRFIDVGPRRLQAETHRQGWWGMPSR